MKIGLVSDSPSVTTGFGKTTKNIAQGLVDAGHQVVCFGFKAQGFSFNPQDYPYKIWTVGSTWQDIMKPYLDYEKPDVLFFNSDIYNLKELLEHSLVCGWQGPICGYLVFDGTPVYKKYLNVLHHFVAIAVSSQAASNYLNKNGFHDLLISPPGVNPGVFYPSQQRVQLRKKAGLADYFLVGVFGRNRERKQLVRVLKALQLLKARRLEDILVYFHCVPNGYWNLSEISSQWDIEEQVLFDKNLLDETKGVSPSPEVALSHETQAASSPCMPSEFTYTHRINCCDLIVNVAHTGDVEHVIIESQACGVPLAHTDDKGIMAEYLGKASIRLVASDVGIGKMGQQLFYVAPETIANAIQEVKTNEELRKQMIREGLENTKKFPWSAMRTMAKDLIKQITL